MSFKECLEDSIYRHIDHQHFYKNYAAVLSAVDKILNQIEKKVLQEATCKLMDDGPHPLWQEPLAFLPKENLEAL